MERRPGVGAGARAGVGGLEDRLRLVISRRVGTPGGRRHQRWRKKATERLGFGLSYAEVGGAAYVNGDLSGGGGSRLEKTRGQKGMNLLYSLVPKKFLR